MVQCRSQIDSFLLNYYRITDGPWGPALMLFSRRSLITALLVTCFVTHPSFAETKRTVAPGRDSRCVDLLKECFAYSDDERSDCFHASGTHSFCAGADLGTLAMRRWSMSPVQNPSLESAPALLGPRLIDGECVNNFDNKWSAELVNGDITADSVRALTATLNSCNRQAPFELMRP